MGRKGSNQSNKQTNKQTIPGRRCPMRHGNYGFNRTVHATLTVSKPVDWLKSLKQFFINVSYHILVASLILF